MLQLTLHSPIRAESSGESLKESPILGIPYYPVMVRLGFHTEFKYICYISALL